MLAQQAVRVSPYTVLVVGDARLAGVLRATLRHEPCHVVAVDDASAALRALAEQPIDVIVCDARAPGVQSGDFCGRLRAEHARTIQVRAGAWTAVDDAPGCAVVPAVSGTDDIGRAIRQALLERDLLGESRRLLRTVRRQSAVIEQLERELQGLAPASRDPAGVVVLSDVPTTPHALVEALQAEVDAADRRLRVHERELRRRTERGAAARSA